jgi:hypothetical protein
MLASGWAGEALRAVAIDGKWQCGVGDGRVIDPTGHHSA